MSLKAAVQCVCVSGGSFSLYVVCPPAIDHAHRWWRGGGEGKGVLNLPPTVHDIGADRPTGGRQCHDERDAPFCLPRIVVGPLDLGNQDKACKETPPLGPRHNHQRPRPRRRGTGVRAGASRNLRREHAGVESLGALWFRIAVIFGFIVRVARPAVFFAFLALAGAQVAVVRGRVGIIVAEVWK